jgi:hypothetical protein
MLDLLKRILNILAPQPQHEELLIPVRVETKRPVPGKRR